MSFITKNEVLRYIHKVFGEDIEIVEAKFSLRLQPSPDDLIGAEPKNPGNCALVHTARRQHGAQMAIFWKNVAYIDLMDTDGVRRVFRFKVTKAARKLITDFDHGEPFEIGRAIILEAPSKNQTLKAGRKRGEANKKEKQKRANRRLRLTAAMAKKKEAVELAARRLREANAKKDRQSLPAIKKRKAEADAAFKAVRDQIAAMDKVKRRRAPKTFDLTTRNGAVGNYNLTIGKHGVHPDFYTPASVSDSTPVA